MFDLHMSRVYYKCALRVILASKWCMCSFGGHVPVVTCCAVVYDTTCCPLITLEQITLLTPIVAAGAAEGLLLYV